MKLIPYFRRHVIPIGVSLLMTMVLLLHSLGILPFEPIQRLENFAYDVRLQWHMPNSVDARLVIVDIDERSIREQGRWPWSRNKLAKLVDVLFDKYQIDALGFDVMFSERDESSGLRQLEALAKTELSADDNFKSALNRLKPQLDYDQLFADSLKGRRVALGYTFSVENQGSKAQGDKSVGSLPPPALRSDQFKPGSIDPIQATAFVGNLPELQSQAMAAGYFSNPTVDADGIFRRAPLLQMYRGELYESLALAMAKLILRRTEIKLNYESLQSTDFTMESLKLGERRLPVDNRVAALIPYIGKQGSFAYVSATDVLQGKASTELLKKQSWVLVGSTAAGLKDLRATPMQSVYAGVEMHANLIAGIVDGGVMERPASAPAFEFLALILIGVLLAIVLPSLGPFIATLLFLGVLASVIGFDAYLWTQARLAMSLASIMLLAASLFVFNMAYGFVIERRGKRLLGGLFGQYVPRELVDEMAKDPAAYSLEGESRELTVLFSDVRGFTSISEGLDPKQLTHLMNEFLTPMTHIIHHHRGTIDKYMGDAIMAFWGAPVHDDQHARHALLAGLEMIAKLETLQGHFKAMGWPPIKVGVGLNTGEMTVGNMGSEFRLAYTVMGDAVNLGSRLEGLTKEYGVQMMVSEFTRAAAPGFVYRELDRVRVKGKDKPVAIYEPICESGQEDEAMTKELALYELALNLYRQQNWSLATRHFAELQGLYPDRYLYQVYAKRIAYLQDNPPGEAWDGSYTFTTK